MNTHEIDELIKCWHDEQYFIETYCKIINPFNGLSTITLTPKQTNLLNRINGKTCIIDAISERQIGVSSVFAVHALWLALFHSGDRIVIMSEHYKHAKVMRQLVRTSYKNLPDFLGVPVVTDHSGSLELDNGSWIHYTNQNSENLRGFSTSLIMMEDFDWYTNESRTTLLKLVDHRGFVTEELIAA